MRFNPRRLRWALGSGARVAAYLLVQLAFQRADGGRVATLCETSVLSGLLLAGEATGKGVWLGASLTVLGAAYSVV
jgi:hypothetical protein